MLMFRRALSLLCFVSIALLSATSCSFEPDFDRLTSHIPGNEFDIWHLGEQWQGPESFTVPARSDERDIYVVFTNPRNEARRSPGLGVGTSVAAGSRYNAAFDATRFAAFDSTHFAAFDATGYAALAAGGGSPDSGDSERGGRADRLSDAGSPGRAGSSVEGNAVPDSALRLSSTVAPGGLPRMNELPSFSTAGSEDLSGEDELRLSGEVTTGTSTTMYALFDCTQQKVADRVTVQEQRSHGGVTLNVWVQDSQWTEDGGPVTAEMVKAVADSFFEDTSGTPGIYEATSELFGSFWGPHDFRALIGERASVDLLLLDILGDCETGGSSGQVIAGYFDARDLYRRSVIETSNERAMFYIHAPRLAARDNDSDWAITDEEPAETLLTIAHEFQHLINFYEKGVRRGVPTDTWLDELMSLQAEEFVASLLLPPDAAHDVLGGENDTDDVLDGILRGSRGLPARLARGREGGTDDEGDLSSTVTPRITAFNQAPSRSLTSWDNRDTRYSVAADVLNDYASAYMFGAWLLRNYGSHDFFHELHNNASGGRDAVTAAVRSVTGRHYTMGQLVDMWMTSVVLSDYDSTGEGLPRGYRMSRSEPENGSDTGDFFEIESPAGTVRIGSVDAWFYGNGSGNERGPRFAAVDASGRWEAPGGMEPVSALVVRAAGGIAGTEKTIEYDTPPGVHVTVISRKSID